MITQEKLDALRRSDDLVIKELVEEIDKLTGMSFKVQPELVNNHAAEEAISSLKMDGAINVERFLNDILGYHGIIGYGYWMVQLLKATMEARI